MKFPLLIRQVNGGSMEPTFMDGNLVLAVRLFHIRKGDIVIAQSRGRDIIKRVADTRKSKIYLLGDNPSQSTDSRALGWFNNEQIIAKHIWSIRLSMPKIFSILRS